MENTLIVYIFDLLSVLTPAYLTLYLTLSLVRENLSVTRLLLGGLILGAFEIIKGKLTYPTILLMVIIHTIALLVAKRDYTIFDFLKVSVIYFVIKVTSWAFESAIKYAFDPNDTLLTLIVSISIILTAFMVKIVNFFTKSEKRLKKSYTIELFSGSKKYETKGYLDTGNMLYDSGKPVIVLSPKIQSYLGLICDKEIAVSTVGGIRLLRGGNVDLKIFLDKKTHKVLRVVYVISDTMLTRGYDVLLHKDMEQI